MRDDVSALFVDPRGPYPSLVTDYWDEARVARLYAGPNRVVGHPPCSVWGPLARINQARYGHLVGDDGGCFASALASVRRWGGVLEHPAESIAWARHGLLRPSAVGWTGNLLRPGEWVTEVCQRNYGHPARKRTWLLLVGDPIPLDWSPPAEPEALVSFLTNHGGRTDLRRLGKREAKATPLAFAHLLVDLAATATRTAA